MDHRVIDNLADLDRILPLIARFHGNIDFYYPMSGFTAHLVAHLNNPYFRIWVAYEGDTPQGYMIGSIEVNYGVLECCIVDAYMEKTDTDITASIFYDAIKWAVEIGCKRVTCHSKRDGALARKYGFQEESTFLVKEL